MRALTVEELGFVSGGFTDMFQVDTSQFDLKVNEPLGNPTMRPGRITEYVTVRGDQRKSGDYNWDRLAAWGITDRLAANRHCQGMAEVQARATDDNLLNWAVSGALEGGTVIAGEVAGLTSVAGRAYVIGLAIVLSGVGQLQSGAIQMERNWIGCR
jgi:hypothetical protein